AAVPIRDLRPYLLARCAAPSERAGDGVSQPADAPPAGGRDARLSLLGAGARPGLAARFVGSRLGDTPDDDAPAAPNSARALLPDRGGGVWHVRAPLSTS